MKGKKRIVVVLMALCMLMTTMGTTFAAVNTCRLSYGEKWDWSPTVFGSSRAWINSGSVANGSERAVYFINAVYPTASTNKTQYSEDGVKLVYVGNSITKSIGTTYYSPKQYFRLLLNVYGTSTIGGIANGVQADYQN